jgi:hypothetical protein
MKWPTITVRFWDHDPRVNDCFGNTSKCEVKARTCPEARRKFYDWHQKHRKGQTFPRIHSIG